jgi:hypothetical protein
VLIEGAGLAAATTLLAWRWRRDQIRLREQRRRFLAGCLGLLQDPSLTQQGADYPVLRGLHRGHKVELRPLADTLALRKLPALWLSVTIDGPTGAPGAIDALLRPTGAEHWSPSGRLPHRLPTPPSLPETTLLRADGEAAEPLVPLLPAGFLGSTHAKEALITPKGVRLVVLVDEAERGPYLVLRQARFATVELDPDRVRPLLEQALALHAAVFARRPALGLAA